MSQASNNPVTSSRGIFLDTKPDGKLTIPNTLRESCAEGTPHVRALLGVIEHAVAAHNKRVDEIAELKEGGVGEQKTNSQEAAQPVSRSAATAGFMHGSMGIAGDGGSEFRTLSL